MPRALVPLLALSSLASLVACESAPVVIGPYTPPTEAWVVSDRAHLRDETGRVRVLRGVNARVEGIFDVEFRDDTGRLPLEEVPALTEDDVIRMRELGLSVLRLPINWSAIEETRGTYDEAYLDRVAAVVELCAAHEIHVLIDFHQDAYSKEIGEDGAPLWAIQPPPEMLLGGPLGDSLEMRRTSGQVARAFETFFDDSEGSVGLDLQQAFIAMAAHVAERFTDEPYVIGYDLYNEPVIDDRSLWRFHARLAPAIRAVDSRHLLFFEPSGLRNLVDRSPFSPEPFADEGGVYAPHLYTLSFLDPRMELDTVTRARLEPNVAQAAREAESWDVPLFVGEWGIRPDSPGSDDYVRFMHELFDERFVSAAVWLWQENSQGSWGFYTWDVEAEAWVEREEVVLAHARIYAEAIAGEPTVMRYDASARSFELRYQGRLDLAPHVIHVPESIAAFDIACDGRAFSPEPTRDPETGRVEIVCPGPGEHVVTIVAR